MNYDKWKLSNPVDDGYGYDMVSSCCGANLYNHDDTDECDICSNCDDECEPIEDYEYKAIQRENYLEERADARRKYGE